MSTPMFRTLLLAGLVVVMSASPALAQTKTDPAPAADADAAPGEDTQLYSCGKAKGPVSVSFKADIELKDLLTWAMGFTCKNFIYEQGVLSRSKKLTIIAPNKMSPQDAYRLFLTGLSTMGLTVIPKGNVLKVIEESQAKGSTVAIKKGGVANSEEFVRLILRPNHVAAQDLADALSVAKSAQGDIKLVAKSGALIITDYSSHVRDMITLTRELDKPMEGAGVYTIKVIHADAKTLADMLGNILGTSTAASGGAPAADAKGGRGGKTTAADIEAAVPSKILADDRTNTLIVVSNEAGYLRVRALVKRLDVSMETEGAGSINVYPLENAKAEELAQTLNNALQGISGQQGGGNTGARAPTRRGGEQAAAAGPVPEGSAAFEGQVRITHDTPTNSLVVISSGRDFIALREVVKKLDAPRRQVFIEAVILELQASNDLDIGTSFHGGDATDGGDLLVGGLQHSNLKSLDVSSLATATGLLGGLIGRELPGSEELLGTSIPSFGVLFQALAKNRNANVLSSPHILTTDNIEAEITVGQNIPYIGGVNIGGFGLPGGGQTGGLSGLGQVSVQRQEVALTMKITPHVNASDMVRLDIEQEIQDVGERDPQLGPTWTKRKIKTTVVVRDQQSIVIGGLMSDRVTYSESKIPVLGDIPLLGYLFKYTTKAKQKTNLLVLLTPYIIEDQLDIEAIVERKVRERQEFLRSVNMRDNAKYMPKLDYRKKRGLIEDINATVESIEADIEMLRGYELKGVDVPDGPLEYEDMPSGAGAEPEPPPAAPPAEPAPEPTKPDAKKK